MNDYIEQTVKAFMKDVSLPLMEQLAHEEEGLPTNYWRNAERFVMKNLTFKLKYLTAKERSWLVTIKDQLRNG